MKLLFLLESTGLDDYFLYTKALVEDLSGDGYEPSIVFTTHGAPSDHTYQLVKDHVLHQWTKLPFRSADPDYLDRLAKHINKHQYDFLVICQATYHRFSVAALYELLEHKPRLIFVGKECSQSVTESAKQIDNINPLWVAVAQNVASRFMADYDVQVIYGPAVVPEDTGADIRAEFGIRGDVKVVGYVGNVDVVNWEPVLEACRRMRCLLLVAGTGDNVPKLSGIKGVKVVPAIPQCLADWYQAFDVFLYPIRGSGFPMLVLEAAVSGCPVATTPVSDIYQLCKDEFGFFKFDPKEIIGGVRVAASRDMERVSGVIRERFSREKFLSGWQILLS